MKYTQSFYLATINHNHIEGIYNNKDDDYYITGLILFRYFYNENKLIIFSPASTYSLTPNIIATYVSIKCEKSTINHETIKYVFIADTIEIKKGS